MKRKGLSQILYLIIAASVLMMIAMVITFTATDTIGGLGGSAENSACGDALEGQCAATSAQAVQVPSTCVTQGQWVESDLSGSVYATAQDAVSGSGGTTSASNYEGGGYVLCNTITS